jgi:hypothetical protein
MHKHFCLAVQALLLVSNPSPENNKTQVRLKKQRGSILHPCFVGGCLLPVWKGSYTLATQTDNHGYLHLFPSLKFGNCYNPPTNHHSIDVTVMRFLLYLHDFLNLCYPDMRIIHIHLQNVTWDSVSRERTYWSGVLPCGQVGIIDLTTSQFPTVINP